jgi:hypothetical protein
MAVVAQTVETYKAGEYFVEIGWRDFKSRFLFTGN